MIIAITPTGGRPEAFLLCEMWMARQTRQPDLWIVVDDVEPQTSCTMNQIHIAPTEPWNDGPSTQHRNILLALDYIERGWHVLPVKPRGKDPLVDLVPHAVLDSSTDPEVVRHWFTVRPDANLAVRCGAASGLVVLDVAAPDFSTAFPTFLDFSGDAEGLRMKALTVQPVPVPATLPLLAIALGALAWRRRRVLH